jgi:hypothetical protein
MAAAVGQPLDLFERSATPAHADPLLGGFDDIIFPRM